MKRLLILMIMVVAGATTLAQAADVQIKVGGVNCGVNGVCSAFTSQPGSKAFNVDFNDGSIPGAPGVSFWGNFALVNGSQTGKFASPTGDSTTYITTPNPFTAAPSSYTMMFDNLGFKPNYFGLFWGSIDDYNSITFYLSDNTTQTVSGAQIAALLGSRDGAYINFFFGDATITKIVMSSQQFAFEADNFAFAATPEPTTMILFGTGLLGLAGGRKWLRRG